LKITDGNIFAQPKHAGSPEGHYLKQLVLCVDSVPGAAIAVHTFGDFVQFNPHLHLIATDGCFSGKGTFTKGPGPEPNDLQELFRYEVLKMLKAEGKINDAVIENMLTWRHSGFNVYCGPTIWPNNDQGLEDLARYIIRACFSQERMTCIPAKDSLDGQAKVIYSSKDGRTSDGTLLCRPCRRLMFGSMP
jgi:hypothetical protein